MSIPALHIEGLTVRYGQNTALSNVCMDVEEGAFLGIIGPNGGGKTTLIKAILGLVPRESGTISVFGREKGAGSVMGYVPQFSAVDRGFPISVNEVVMTAFLKGPLHPFFRYSPTHRKKAEEYLKRVGIPELKDRQISQLSGGEFQRMLIARALATEPKILLLDEPTASVDPSSRQQIFELLSELNRTVTILLVTHDMMAVASQVSTIACLNKSLVYHGEPELTDETVSRMYSCPVDLIAHGVPHRVLGGHGHCCGEEEGKNNAQ